MLLHLILPVQDTKFNCMSMFRALGLSLILISFASLLCAQTASTAMASKLIEKDGRRLLYGALTSEQLFFDFPSWKAGFDAYKPDSSAVEKLKPLVAQPGVSVLVFLGTWCGDSRREVPAFLKVSGAAGLKPSAIALYGVDVAKKMEGGLIEQYQIKRVPTFVFLKDGKEAGRITEYVKTNMENDMLGALSSTAPESKQ